MDAMSRARRDAPYDNGRQVQDQRDLVTQVIISGLVGLAAFLTFCILRPRWTALYAARKRQKDAAASLPDLPTSFFGWIPTLYAITDKEVLASAGLDAYVFLAFFRMAIKFLSVAFFFALVVMTPVHTHFEGSGPIPPPRNTSTPTLFHALSDLEWEMEMNSMFKNASKPGTKNPNNPGHYLWMHVVFVYLYTALALYLLITETRKIIRVRQEYLGSQCTVTDRTVRLSGIPPDLRSEEKIKDLIEQLSIGRVERVTICRNWEELDQMMSSRDSLIRKLEEAWTVHLGHRRVERNLETLPIAQPPPPDPAATHGTNGVADEDADEDDALLALHDRGPASTTPYTRERPKTTIRYGVLKLRSRQIDAIDYYEEKLRVLDGQIQAARKKDFTPTPLAFVTLDSVAACQMVVQAILDPSPLQLLAHQAPAPADVVWSNTYVSRPNRMARSWVITTFVGLLTIFWLALLVPLAGLTDYDSIRKVWPSLGGVLEEHAFVKSLIQTQLTTLVVSLLSIAVPYLYDYLSNLQGMISQSDVELSVVSKNFFFTFFNLFLFFTILKSATSVFGLWKVIQDSLKDTSYIANLLAESLEGTAHFYANLIILQGFALFPFRLLEFGTVALYPLSLIGAKTPRDYAELMKPPEFKYGFFLPQSLLIFIICIVYSVLPPNGVLILGFGLLYFIIGAFTYKYQLLYAMDHRQHSTGRTWTIVSYRMILGLGVFQLAMAGWLALKQATWPSLVVTPLIFGTIWFSYFYARTFEPLTQYIALRSIQRDGHHHTESPDTMSASALSQSQRQRSDTADGSTIDEERERGQNFVNPNLISPLEDIWIAKKQVDSTSPRPRHVLDEESEENV
ncbi:MAG: hypothetical protein M1838_005416 [Thelocarpon superellum]|nr:MAG: hypothetical protein M1838_005416 [Thelocarpon superellum]